MVKSGSQIITKYLTPKRHDVRLLRTSKEIEEITGEWAENPRPRCGKCHSPTEVLRGYDGREVGRWCNHCGYFWVLIEFEKTITVTEYMPWGDFENA